MQWSRRMIWLTVSNIISSRNLQVKLLKKKLNFETIQIIFLNDTNSLAAFVDVVSLRLAIFRNLSIRLQKNARSHNSARVAKTGIRAEEKRRGGGARNARITSIAIHACPMKRLGACKHHNPTIRSRLIYLPIKAYWKHVFLGAAAKTGPTDVMRCDERKEREGAVKGRERRLWITRAVLNQTR